MNRNEITKSFDNLTKDINTLLPELNQQSSELIDKHQYQEAKEIISKAERVLSLRNKLESLKEEWLDLELHSLETRSSSDEDKLKVSPETERKFRSQPHTKTKEYLIPILQALVNLGGSAKRQHIFQEIENIMSDQLLENDKNPLPSNPSVTRLQRIATSAGRKLRKEGYITIGPKTGVWEIAEKGRIFLEESEGIDG